MKNLGVNRWEISFEMPAGMSQETLERLVRENLEPKMELPSVAIGWVDGTVTITLPVQICWQWTRLRTMLEELSGHRAPAVVD